MVTKALYDAGVRSGYLHATGLGAIGLCIGLWIRDRKSTRLNSSHNR
jgi:hypothetical protein